MFHGNLSVLRRVAIETGANCVFCWKFVLTISLSYNEGLMGSRKYIIQLLANAYNFVKKLETDLLQILRWKIHFTIFNEYAN